MRVLIVDDHALFLEGIKNLLLAHEIEVAGTASNGLEALEKARTLLPDVILMDLQMPECDGLASTRLIKAELPEIPIVILTVSEEEADLFEAIKSGASGYLLKKLQAHEFLELLADLEKGEPPLAPGMAMKVLKEFAHQSGPVVQVPSRTEAAQLSELSPREEAILILVSRGMTYREVAAALCFSERTVKHHIKEVMDRLRLRNRAHVMAYAAKLGLTEKSSDN